jgi:TPR repeat protein
MNHLARFVALCVVGLVACTEPPNDPPLSSPGLEVEQQRAAQGDPDAQLGLGWRYVVGDGVPESEREGRRWMTLAATQGYAKAQYELGVYYSDEDAPSHNDEEAVKWLRRSAEQGFTHAQFSLGMMYATGRGVAQDRVEAYAWVSLAQASGDGNFNAWIELRESLSSADLQRGERRLSEYGY